MGFTDVLYFGGKMKIALINAPPKGIYEPTYDTPSFTRLSLACLAAYLRHHGYGDLLLIDAKFEKIDYSEIRRRLLAFQADAIGYTAFTNEVVQCARVAAIAHEVAATCAKTVVNILGGVHSTAMSERSLREFSQFDFTVIGEGEQTFLELIQHLDGSLGRPLSEVKGIGYLEAIPSSPYRQTMARSNISDQTLLPMPAWDLLPVSPQYLVMSARGCPFACSFCQNPNGRIVRKRGVDQFLKEVEWLVRRNAGKAEFNICDEIFTIDRNRAHAILDGLSEIGFGKSSHLQFIAQTHINTVDEALLLKIANTGCTSLGFGLESGDEAILQGIGKGTNLSQIRRIMSLAKKCGVKVTSYFILGQPNETWKTALRSIKLAVKLNPQIPIFGIMVPYPGTKIWEWANRREKGYRLKSLNWNDYNKQVGNALEFEGISRRKMEVLQLLGYVSVFLANLRFADFLKFAWKYRIDGFSVLKNIIRPAFGFFLTNKPLKN